MGLLATLLAGASLLTGVVTPKELDKCSKVYEYQPTSGELQGHTFKYRVIVPSSLDPGEKHPLLMWLYGRTKRGETNPPKLGQLGFFLPDRKSIEKFPAYILMVQHSREDRWRQAAGEDPPGDMLTVAYEILQKTINEYPIDENRICLSGVSCDGSSCWEMAMRYPSTFSAVVPIASGGCDLSRLAKLERLPVWAFHNLYDEDLSPTYVETTVSALKYVGGNVHLTLFPAKGHDCWAQSLGNPNTMSWMLSQQRGVASWAPPGCYPWSWWRILLAPALVLAAVRVGWSLRERRS